MLVRGSMRGRLPGVTPNQHVNRPMLSFRRELMSGATLIRDYGPSFCPTSTEALTVCTDGSRACTTPGKSQEALHYTDRDCDRWEMLLRASVARHLTRQSARPWILRWESTTNYAIQFRGNQLENLPFDV
jgi:hypothetical protein